MKVEINAVGLACPGPVLEVKKAIDGGARDITIIVDNPASVENVTRFFKTKGFDVTSSKQGDTYVVSGIIGGGVQVVEDFSDKKTEAIKTLVLITSEVFGRGDDVLGRKLMLNYLKTLGEMGDELWQLIFVNGGVKWVTLDSEVLETLKNYEKSGVQIFACGTCLEHFGLTEQKAVGASTNMLDIISATQVAEKVISLS